MPEFVRLLEIKGHVPYCPIAYSWRDANVIEYGDELIVEW